MGCEKVKPLWEKLSGAYANGVAEGGTVHVFHNAKEGISLNSIWRTVEYPALKDKGGEIIISFC